MSEPKEIQPKPDASIAGLASGASRACSQPQVTAVCSLAVSDVSLGAAHHQGGLTMGPDRPLTGVVISRWHDTALLNLYQALNSPQMTNMVAEVLIRKTPRIPCGI